MSANKNKNLTSEQFTQLCKNTQSRREALFYAIQNKIGLNKIWKAKKKIRFRAYNLKNCKSSMGYNTIIFDSNIINQDGFVTPEILAEILDMLNTKDNGYKLMEKSDSDLRWWKDDNSPYLQFRKFDDYKKKEN